LITINRIPFYRNQFLQLIDLKKLVCGFLMLFFAHISQGQQPQKNFVLRTMDWGYRIVEGDSAHPRKSIIVPIPILAYKPETRWIVGVSLNAIFRVHRDSITRPSAVRINISYSQNQQLAFIPEANVFTRNNKWNLRGRYTYTNFGENYYGIGKDAPASNKEHYTFTMQRANLKVAYRFLPGLYAGLQYNYERMYDVNADSSGILYTTKPKGYDGYNASGAGFTLYYDNRDHVYFPHHGQIIELSNVFYGTGLGGAYRFTNITLDARKYVHLWKENVLALQGFVNLNDGNIPFRMQGVLGSDMFMRGYYNGRFRDKHAMAFQAELRKTVWGPVGVVVFAGGGTVSDNKWDLFNGIKPNYGLGLRIKAIPKEKVNIAIDYGFGSQGNSALYIGMNEAF
jgi:outer membrane protein assembly factor BamA